MKWWSHAAGDYLWMGIFQSSLIRQEKQNSQNENLTLAFNATEQECRSLCPFFLVPTSVSSQVKNPMDLGTILCRVDDRQYQTITQFMGDLGLISKAAKEYWEDDPHVILIPCAKRVEIKQKFITGFIWGARPWQIFQKTFLFFLEHIFIICEWVTHRWIIDHNLRVWCLWHGNESRLWKMHGSLVQNQKKTYLWTRWTSSDLPNVLQQYKFSKECRQFWFMVFNNIVSKWGCARGLFLGGVWLKAWFHSFQTLAWYSLM